MFLTTRFNKNQITWLFTALLIAFAWLAPRCSQLGVFFAPDEQLIWQATNTFALSLLHGNLSGTAAIFYPGVPVLWAETIGGLVQQGWSWLTGNGIIPWEVVFNPELPFADLAQKRLVLVLFALPLMLLLWAWIEDLLGREIGILAGLLIALDPFLLAESRVIRMEAFNTIFLSLAVVALVVALNKNRQTMVGVSGGFAALATLTKMSSAAIVPFAGIIIAGWFLIVHLDQSRQAGIRLVIRFYLIWLVVFGLACLFFWPALWVDLPGTLKILLDYVSRVGNEGVDGRGVFFAGQIFPDDPGPWFYPVSFLFRVAVPVLPGLLGLFAFLLPSVRQWIVNRLPAGTRWKPTLLILAAFAVGYILFMNTVAIKYDRYLLPVFPAVDILAAVGLWSSVTFFTGRSGSKRLQPAAFFAGMISLVLVCQLWTIAKVHPYYYPYYNPLLGGIQQASRFIRIGAGEGFDVAGRYLSTLLNAKEISVASARSRDLSYYFPGKTIPLDNLSGVWTQADYVFLYISQLQRGKHPPELIAYLKRQPPVYNVVLNGFTYGTVYHAPAGQYYSGTKLEGRATLYSYTLNNTNLKPGDQLTLATYYRNEGQLPTDRFYVKLVDGDGYVWAESTIRPKPGFEEAFVTPKTIVEGETVLPVPVGILPGSYVLKMGYIDTLTNQIIGEFTLSAEGDDITVSLPANFALAPINPQPAHKLDFSPNNTLSLIGFDTGVNAISAGEKIWLTLYWQALADVQTDYVLAIQLIDPNGAEAAYWLGRPARSVLPTNQWRQNQIVQDPWLLTMPDSLDSGQYRLNLTVYDAATSQPIITTTLQTIAVP